jgi:hypothetical protein
MNEAPEKREHSPPRRLNGDQGEAWDGEWRDDMKDAVKQAIKEWLDEQFAAAGRWSIAAFIASLVCGALWLILTAKGWKPPP